MIARVQRTEIQLLLSKSIAEHGWTVTADAIGVRGPTLWKWEQGKHRPTPLHTRVIREAVARLDADAKERGAANLANATETVGGAKPR